ncbi:GNAT family N-acetyltransferase [Micromonosporaceae bacterium Da 78-11]
MFPPVQIVSGGLEIREFGPQDAALVTAFVAADDRTALPPGFPSAVAEVVGWLADGVHRRRLSGDGAHLAIVERSTGRIVGSAGLRETDWAAGRTEIGYGIQVAERGRGHATEAARAVGRWALTEGGMRRVELHSRVDNPASVRVAEKAGYRLVSTERIAEQDGCAAHDLSLFAMITSDLRTDDDQGVIPPF